MSEILTYTLAEAQRELRRRECQKDGHGPDSLMRTVGDPLGLYYCACGEIKWEPKRVR